MVWLGFKPKSSFPTVIYRALSWPKLRELACFYTLSSFWDTEGLKCFAEINGVTFIWLNCMCCKENSCQCQGEIQSLMSTPSNPHFSTKLFLFIPE